MCLVIAGVAVAVPSSYIRRFVSRMQEAIKHSTPTLRVGTETIPNTEV
jgi:hypothetical protein